MRLVASRGVPFATDRQQRTGPTTPVPRSVKGPLGSAAPAVDAAAGTRDRRFHRDGRRRAEGIAGASGQAAVEFVLVLPLLVTLLFLIFELAVVLLHALTVNDAAGAIARAAAVYRFNGEPNACDGGERRRGERRRRARGDRHLQRSRATRAIRSP